jgi:hypothetical protein
LSTPPETIPLAIADVTAELGCMPMLPGEDAQVFAKFRADVMAAAKPRDVIEQILVGEFVCQYWEAIRWRRYKANLLRLSSERTRARLAAGGGVEDLIVGETEVFMSGAFARALGEKLSLIERLDFLLESAEARRASALRELHRHREALAAQTEKAAQRIEDAEFSIPEDGGDKRLKNGLRP